MRRIRLLTSATLALLMVLVIASAVSAQTPPTLQVVKNPIFGNILTGSNGLTLYLFTKDTPDTSACYDTCATNWPPLLATGGDPVAPAGLPGKLGLTTRTDGAKQVTYNGMPLYYYAKDSKPGDTTGQGVGGVWFVVNPSPTVQFVWDAKYGYILTDGAGMALYLYTKDQSGTSVCYDNCAVAWPPLLTAGTGPTPTGSGILLGTTTRTDGGTQVTYNGAPLYYYAKDAKPGDRTGQGVGNVWYLLNPQPTVNTAPTANLGTILTDGRGMTLYWFTKDKDLGGASTCYETCATNWPPLLLAMPPKVADGLVGQFGLADRTDSAVQLTYNGMPLYYYAKDAKPGDTTGQGVGGAWYVMNPTAVPATAAAPAAPAATAAAPAPTAAAPKVAETAPTATAAAPLPKTGQPAPIVPMGLGILVLALFSVLVLGARHIVRVKTER